MAVAADAEPRNTEKQVGAGAAYGASTGEGDVRIDAGAEEGPGPGVGATTKSCPIQGMEPSSAGGAGAAVGSADAGERDVSLDASAKEGEPNAAAPAASAGSDA